MKYINDSGIDTAHEWAIDPKPVKEPEEHAELLVSEG